MIRDVVENYNEIIECMAASKDKNDLVMQINTFFSLLIAANVQKWARWLSELEWTLFERETNC